MSSSVFVYVCLTRWATLTGKPAIRESDGAEFPA